MNIALILAGGTGQRMGTALPKQFLSLGNDVPIIITTIRQFAYHPEINKIMVVCHKDFLKQLAQLLDGEPYHKDVTIIAGGTTRKDSSYIGLCALESTCDKDDIVLIHDGARPFVSAEIISGNIACAKENSACTTAIPVQDSILISHDGKQIDSVPSRNELYAIQTPQSFKLDTILQGHRTAPSDIDFTDDTAILRRQGIAVSLVPGEKKNLKITTIEDIAIANSLV